MKLIYPKKFIIPNNIDVKIMRNSHMAETFAILKALKYVGKCLCGCGTKVNYKDEIDIS